MTLKAVHDPMSYLSRIALLGSIRADVDKLEAGLSPEITSICSSTSMNQRPTGVSEFRADQIVFAGVSMSHHPGTLQVMLFGIKTILHRIELDMIDRASSTHVLSTVYEAAMKTASESVTLIENLTVADRQMFWMPCMSFTYTWRVIIPADNT